MSPPIRAPGTDSAPSDPVRLLPAERRIRRQHQVGGGGRLLIHAQPVVLREPQAQTHQNTESENAYSCMPKIEQKGDTCNVSLDSDDPGDHNSCPMYGHRALKHVIHATCPAPAAAGGERTRGPSGTLHGDGRLNERNGFARIRGGRGLSEAALVPRGAGEPER